MRKIMKKMSPCLYIFLVLDLLFFLSGCGGGSTGGQSNLSVTSVTPVTRSSSLATNSSSLSNHSNSSSSAAANSSEENNSSPVIAKCPQVKDEGIVIWPNNISCANSDAWLRENHDAIVQLRPRVLVLNGYNRVTQQGVEQFISTLFYSVAEGSRYHAYADPQAPVFLQYQLAKLINLSDTSGRDMAKVWPILSDDSLDYETLFSKRFAAVMQYKDPENPSVDLTLCELLERGLINEIWTVGNRGVVWESKSRAQVYDKNLQPISGNLSNCAGNGCYEPGPSGSCKVTVRMMEVNVDRGPGCFTHAQAHGFENMRSVNPYFSDNSKRFFNLEMNTIYNVNFGSFYDCVFSFDANPKCISFLSPTHITNQAGLSTFDLTQWGQGCGNVHFPPNATYHYDYSNLAVNAANSCKHYSAAGLNDQLENYNYSLVEALDKDPRHQDCGGGWQVYMRQSFPGFKNEAKDTNGLPMKNWWPFLFY